MKGIVFTEFLDFVEMQSGYEAVDAILIEADPPSGGAYTAVGDYHYSEMVSLIAALSQYCGAPAPHLLRSFGRHLFQRFAASYPPFFAGCDDAFEFIQNIESQIHIEVQKLYPDAELPQLKAERTSENTLEIQYRSCRPFGELCIGLIEGCGEYFGVSFDMETAPATGGINITVHRVGSATPSQSEEAVALS